MCLFVSVFVCGVFPSVCLHPTASCCQRGGGANEHASERELESERSVVVSELASVVSVAAEQRWIDFTHTHIASPCHTRTTAYLHTLLFTQTHTHIYLFPLWLSHMLNPKWN